MSDWQKEIQRLAQESWENQHQPLPLNHIQPRLKELGIDLSNVSGGRKLSAFLTVSANNVVNLVRCTDRPELCGIVPLWVEPKDAEARLKLLSDQRGGPVVNVSGEPKAKRIKSALSEQSLWTLDEHGEVVRKVPVGLKIPLSKEAPPIQGKHKGYATNKHPSIAAVIGRLYYFQDASKAKRKISVLRDHFVFSAKSGLVEQCENVLWIRGFSLEAEEIARGYKGHYAGITIEQKDDGFTLNAQKIEWPLAEHPQKERRVSKHPNWGHPFLRKVQKTPSRAVLDTALEAQEKLQEFHREYPDVTIPGDMQLLVHVWVKEGGDIAKGHIQKIILCVQETPEGLFRIFWRPNYVGIRAAANLSNPAPELEPPQKMADTKIEDNVDKAISKLFGQF